MQLLINELVYRKIEECDIVLDKLSTSDYIAYSSLLVVREAEGPNILNDFAYGRKDVTKESEVGDTKLIPNASNYKENLRAKGFSDEEIVALASIEGFGIITDPKQASVSKYPKLDNYLYKTILSGSTQFTL